MAAINDLIARIQDPELRMRIEKEVKDLTKQKKFGLVFENHIPEMTLLYDYPISRGCKVICKSDDDKKLSELDGNENKQGKGYLCTYCYE